MLRTTPVAERFWKYVTKTEGDGCWEWTGHRTRLGYGRLKIGHRPKARSAEAYRISWEIHHGPIPEGLCVCHRCDNPPCVRPDHLFLGTHRDNMLDAAAKGFMGRARAERNGNARLTWEIVRDVRRLYATGLYSQKQLAERFGMCPASAHNVVTGKYWRDV